MGQAGPYPFVVDSGSSTSIIDSTLTSSLQLKNAGTADLGGSGCATTGDLVAVPALHVGDVAIASQDMVSTSLSDWAGESVDGVLGSDVLGRFAAFELNLTKETLTFLGPEGPPPTSNSISVGKLGATPPSVLLGGKTVVDVPLTIVEAPGTISVFKTVTLNAQGSYAFAVGTGSPFSAMSAGTASSLHIADNGTGVAPGGIGCTGSVPILEATPVATGLYSQTLSTMRRVTIAGIKRAGITGTLGLDFLGVPGIIVVDYANANLALLSAS